MRFSFATVVLAPRGGRAAPPDRSERALVLRWAAETGFTGIELNPRWYDILSLTEAAVMEFGRESSEAGLCVSGLNLNRGILTRTPLAERHRAEAERAIEVAAMLKAEVLNLSLSMPSLPTPDRPPLRGCDVPACRPFPVSRVREQLDTPAPSMYGRSAWFWATPSTTYGCRLAQPAI